MNKDRAFEIGVALRGEGRKLRDDVTLDDLYNYHIGDGLMAGNPPKKWLKILSELNPSEKRSVSIAIGKANRLLSRLNGTNATLGELRNIEPEFLLAKAYRSTDRLSEDSVNFLLGIFKKS